MSGVLIVGGYGHVGRRIAARLLKAGVGMVRLAGRDAIKAHQAAAQLGCEGSTIDLTSPNTWTEPLAGIRCVVVCVDQAVPIFPSFVLERGFTYVDITADDAFFRKVEGLDDLARSRNGRGILSVGLAPGLTNLLVKACTEGMDKVEMVRIGILLGLGDAHGPAAIDWTLRNLSHTDASAIEVIRFGEQQHGHLAVPFDFADQHVVRRTLGIEQARTYLAFSSPLMSRTAFAMLRFIAVRPSMRRVVQAAMHHIRLGSDRAALSIMATGKQGGATITRTMMIEGRGEAEITALVAAFVVEHALRNALPPGIRHIEKILSIHHLLPRLREEGITLIS